MFTQEGQQTGRRTKPKPVCVRAGKDCRSWKHDRNPGGVGYFIARHEATDLDTGYTQGRGHPDTQPAVAKEEVTFSERLTKSHLQASLEVEG